MAKYYGVKAGRNIGIYKTWDECRKQVTGYKGAIYKSFLKEEDAREYVYGTVSVNSKSSNTINNTPLNKNSGKHYDIFVDGSYSNAKKQYSWGFAVYSSSKVIYTDAGIGKNTDAISSRNVAGELEATIEAVKWAESQDVDTITIHHDYMGISAWAVGDWKTNKKLTQDYERFIKPYLSWINFNKVAGHSGVEGNELADKLAGSVLE